MIDVKIKDRKEEIEYLRMALNMCELKITYIGVDLLLEVQKELKKKGSKFSVSDAAKIFHMWQNKWDDYFDHKDETTQRL